VIVNSIVICTTVLPITSGATDPSTPNANETVLKPSGHLKQIENLMRRFQTNYRGLAFTPPVKQCLKSTAHDHQELKQQDFWWSHGGAKQKTSLRIVGVHVQEALVNQG
jgi:hypothetical protein